MISIVDVTLSFGGFKLLDGISFHISESDKIGLTGKNGAGKSTLMRLITGETSPTSGRIDIPPDLMIGYLPQIMSHHKGRTVIEEAMSVFSHLSDMEKEMESISSELAERDDYESDEYINLIQRLNNLNDTLSLEGGMSPRARAEKTLLGLGFLESELNRKTETFSQGWNMRIELAKILLSDPDVMLLDEPTNHLDIESIEWFEDYLKSYKGAVLLVSHDRRFLDSTTMRTVEIMLGKIHDYDVPYSRYTVLREERLSQQKAAYANQQKMISDTEDFINRFRYKPTKSNQVQSRIKALEKLERIEVEETDNKALTVKFPPAPRSGDIVFKAENLVAGYPGKIVFSTPGIQIRRGEKVALVGRNGEGKTTLMRIIAGELRPIEGVACLGHNVSLGYYAQNQEEVLDQKDTVFSTLDRIAVGDVRRKLRDILGAFLFSGEDIDKRVSVLSGGERSRLGMARLLLQPYNLLALDEPTNHMDIRSKDVLKQALSSYDGTLVAVSHDRDFLDGLVDRVLEFRDGKIYEHLGSVSEFLRKRKLESLQELERKELPEAKATSDPARTDGNADWNRRREKSREQKKILNRIDYLEGKISEQERRMKEIESVLSAPGENDDVIELTREYLERQRELGFLTAEWEELMVKID